VFSYEVLTPAALTFFVSYADGAVESLWSIDQYFEFVLVLMLSTGLAFQVGRAQRRAWHSVRACVHAIHRAVLLQMSGLSAGPPRHVAQCSRSALRLQVPVIQIMLGQLGLVTSEMMFSQWRFVVVGATVAAAVLTPSTDPFTQTLLAVPLVGLYMGGASCVRLLEERRRASQSA
jgi:sec-independent protein translocase protein TatC